MEEIGKLGDGEPSATAFEAEADNSNNRCENEHEQGEQLKVVVADRVLNRPHVKYQPDANQVPELCVLANKLTVLRTI